MQITYAKGDLYHPLTVIACWAMGLLLGDPDFFAVMAAIFFVGRELAQAEYKWIERYGGGLRANMPFLAPLDTRVWDFHSWFWNLTLPAIICVALIFTH